MRPLELHLESSLRSEVIAGVESFVGEDASGSFGVLPGHERLVTVLEFGLSRFRVLDKPWQYIAAPGAVLFLDGDELHFATRRYLLGDDFEIMRRVLEEQIRTDERTLHSIKASLKDLEQQMLKRLWRLGRRDGAPQ